MIIHKHISIAYTIHILEILKNFYFELEITSENQHLTPSFLFLEKEFETILTPIQIGFHAPNQ